MSRSVRITGTGEATSARTHLQSIHMVTNGAGRLTLTNGSGGATMVDLDTDAAGTFSFPLSNSGVHFDDGVNVSTLTNIDAATLVFR